MKVIHLSTRDIAGGAGRAAFRLHTEMLKRGIDSTMFVKNKERHGDSLINTVSLVEKRVYSLFKGAINQLLKRFVSGNNVYLFSTEILGVKIAKRKVVQDADVIYIHWITSGFITVRELRNILMLGKSVVFVLHDMWAMTGGCHYSFDCDKYVNGGCKDCPQLDSKFGKRSVQNFFKLKIRAFSNFSNLKIVNPSEWLSSCAKQSEILSSLPILTIPNVLDRSIFKPLNQSSIREVFCIADHVKLILFIADNGASNPYKGWSYLQDALSLFFKTTTHNIELMVLGGERDPEIEQQLSCKVHFIGRLYDEYSLSMVYNAADLFVTPSLADNLPNTILESLSCGTPVVAFNVGGIPDMVLHKKNGYLSKYKDVNDLACGLEYVLSNDLDVALPTSFNTDSIIKEHLKMQI